MSGQYRSALTLGALCAAGAAWLAAPAPAAADLQARDTTVGGDTAAVDTAAELHAKMSDPRLDSLRARAARFRVAIMQLRVRYEARVQRVESGLRFELPYPPSLPGSDAEWDVDGPLVRVAELARRYYPSASIAVLGTVDGHRPPCGSDAERSRAREIADRLRQGLWLDPDRIRRADCVRAGVAERDGRPGAGADTVPGATIYIEWDSPEGSS